MVQPSEYNTESERSSHLHSAAALAQAIILSSLDVAVAATWPPASCAPTDNSQHSSQNDLLKHKLSYVILILKNL